MTDAFDSAEHLLSLLDDLRGLDREQLYALVAGRPGDWDEVVTAVGHTAVVLGQLSRDLNTARGTDDDPLPTMDPVLRNARYWAEKQEADRIAYQRRVFGEPQTD